ncbi:MULTISPECIES: ATP synthase F1 subunit delta [unclassified Bartonella]|uniref:ATP synthase F1 subunit delta n=1 Tax=unclassified Bartonella TaxID=2645622 RepID=UPI000999B068|nr:MULTISPECIES: ATP synthase F1 subunit delta [unclassified Bartonella]AQX28497.1 ATP synthase F1 subcomplex delta subunit [Bartonella sp. JB15]AQX29762.1 ATP synthase F1 subcomplex delta subunit [Bartonella sp. JB63]
MSDSVSLVPLPLMSQRYAKAFFDLAQEAGCVEQVEKEVASFLKVLEQNEDLQHFVQNPFFSVRKQKEALNVLCQNMEFAHQEAGRIFRNFLGVIAANRRLFALLGILQAFQRHLALFRGEFLVQVTSACPLNVHQKEMLCAALESVIKRSVVLQVSVDPTILGGFIIRLGSYQIDASLVTKLSSLKLVLKKEVS